MQDLLTHPLVQNGVELKPDLRKTPQPCLMCGRLAYPVGGRSLFIQNTADVVCDPCARIHAPTLLRIRDADLVVQS